jgi:hypothetical protein
MAIEVQPASAPPVFGHDPTFDWRPGIARMAGTTDAWATYAASGTRNAVSERRARENEMRTE